MPCCKTHQRISTIAGAGLGFYLARECPLDAAAVRIAAAIFATRIGGALPDIIEPANSSWHRGTAHSLAVGGGLTWAALQHLPRAIAGLDEAARQLRRERLALVPGDPNGSSMLLEEMALHAVTAVVAGLVLGYVLHLAADGCTSRGLPLC
jgi:hypothetical protein